MTKGRWRKLGPGGVLECSNTCSDWAAQLLRLPPAAPSDDEPRNHNMTEASLEIGRLAFHAVFLACAGQLRLDLRIPRGLAPLNMALRRLRSWLRPALRLRIPTFESARWRRMLLRALARFNWSREGVRLWYVKHPELRRLPFPYPSVSSAAQWQLQVQSMVQSGCYPLRWVGRGVDSQAHLSWMTWFRNRVGLNVEGPVLTGMLAARRLPGRTQQLKTAALKEEAETATKKGDLLKVARSLLGPRGGLPTLKGDWRKIAALLHVEVSKKDTIKTLRGGLRWQPRSGLCRLDQGKGTWRLLRMPPR